MPAQPVRPPRCLVRAPLLLTSAIVALSTAGQASTVPQGETVAGGDYVILPVGALDDSIPLPVAPETRAGELADERLAPSSGDPFFLGFAAGPYYPPADERLDPGLIASALAPPDDGRPEGEAFAFVMFSKRMTQERVAVLEELGARVLGFHPHYCLSVALPTEVLGEVAELAFVRWLGQAQPWQKVHPVLTRELASKSPAEEVELWVDVHDSDLGPDASYETFGSAVETNPGGVQVALDDPKELPRRWKSGGWRGRALEQRGITVHSYSDSVRAFRVRARAYEVEELARLDYVQFVELASAPVLMHEESMPMAGADFPRGTHDGSHASAVVAAQVDSGFDNMHTAMNHGWGLNWNLSGSSSGPNVDGCGHGTHVGGTIRGLPIAAQDGYTGAAPGLGWGATGRYLNIKLFDDSCFWGLGIDEYEPIFAITRAAHMDSLGNVTPRPHIINNSWGSPVPGPYYGTEVGARAFDTEVYFHGQQHINSAGNFGQLGGQTIGETASAKNVLAVGAANTWKNQDSGYPGNLAHFSSRGPTADLRWKPNLVAPGVEVLSAEAGTTHGFIGKDGTSMAAPHVTGIAAQLLDRHAFLRYKPAVLSALMMAGSMTKDSTLLSAPSFASNHHLNTYGTGRIDAYKASGGNSQQAVYFWGFTQDASGWGQVDFPVGANATQVTIVMHYKERPATAGASVALVNDLDLWIDREPFTPGGNTGEYFSQQSTRDNTEVRILNNPAQGDWRLKVYPESVGTGAFSHSNVGLCAIIEYADVTPEVTFEMSPSLQYVKPGEEFDVTGSVYCPTYIASAVFLETTGPPPLMDAAEITMADGAIGDLTDNQHGARLLLLGDIPGLTTREVRWTAHYATEGPFTWTVVATSDNIEGGQESDFVTVVVDGTPPLGPSDLTSTSHAPGVPSCADALELTWTAATDPLAGLEGYGYVLDHSPNTAVTDPTLQLPPNATTLELAIAPGPGWYLHLRARDRSGNWGGTQHAGPFLQQPASAASYCVAAPNSAGAGGAHIGQTGSLSIAANDFVLTCAGLPTNKPCLFFYGPSETQQPFGNGFRCVSGAITRLAVTNTGSGAMSFPLDFTNLPPTGPIQPGDTRRFQNWYRDPVGGGAGFNLSDGLRVTFCD